MPQELRGIFSRLPQPWRFLFYQFSKTSTTIEPEAKNSIDCSSDGIYDIYGCRGWEDPDECDRWNGATQAELGHVSAVMNTVERIFNIAHCRRWKPQAGSAGPFKGGGNDAGKCTIEV
jgi:hypothetical protein